VPALRADEEAFVRKAVVTALIRLILDKKQQDAYLAADTGFPGTLFCLEALAAAEGIRAPS
jgi:hypothetical protein